MGTISSCKLTKQLSAAYYMSDVSMLMWNLVGVPTLTYSDPSLPASEIVTECLGVPDV